MQRVRIGLTGLSIVFLVVVLAAAMFGFASNEPRIVTDAGGNVVVTQNTDDAVADEGAPKEPLAELGVTPGNAPDGATTNTATPARR